MDAHWIKILLFSPFHRILQALEEELQIQDSQIGQTELFPNSLSKNSTEQFHGYPFHLRHRDI